MVYLFRENNLFSVNKSENRRGYVYEIFAVLSAKTFLKLHFFLMDKFMLNCSINDQDVLHLFICNTDSSRIRTDISSNIVIDGMIYHPNLANEEISVIVRLIQNHWCYIQTIALHDELIPYNEILASRSLLNQYMNLVKLSLNACNDKEQKLRFLNISLIYS